MKDDLSSPKVLLIQSYLRLNGFRDVKSQREKDDVLFLMTFDGDRYHLKVSNQWLEAMPLKCIESRLNAMNIVTCLLQHRPATIGPLPV